MASRCTVFRDSWKEEKDENGKFQSWLQSTDFPGQAFCSLCKKEFSVRNGGITRVKEHASSRKHKKRASLNSKQDAFENNETHLSTIDDLLSDAVCDAEIRWCLLTAEEDLSLDDSDSFIETLKAMFVDSEICQQMKMTRLKLSYGISFGISTWIREDILSPILRETCFSIIVDERTVDYSRRWLAILVKYVYCKKVYTDLLCLTELEDTSARHLADVIEAEMNSRAIPMENCKAIMSDSGNVEFVRLLKTEAPCILDIAGCCLHYAHDSANRVAFDNGIEELFDDIFSYLHFSKAPSAFSNFQTLIEAEPLKFVRHASSTRWLEVLDVVLRFIQMQPVFTCFFENLPESEKQKKQVERILQRLNEPDLLLYMHFLAFALKPLKEFELLLQSGTTVIHTLYSSINQLLTTVITSFVRPELIVKYVDLKEVKENVPLEEQLSDEQLLIGDGARNYLSDDQITSQQQNLFFESVRYFYTEMLKGLIHCQPIERHLLKCVQFLDPAKRSDIEEDDVIFVSKHLAAAADSDIIRAQWRRFVADTDLIETPDVVEFWTSSEVQAKYDALNELAIGALVLPYGNAEIERVMSWFDSIVSKDRNRLHDPTLNGLLTIRSFLLSRNITSATLGIDSCLRGRFRDAESTYQTHLNLQEELKRAQLAAEAAKEASQEALRRKREEESEADEVALKKRRLAHTYIAEAQRLMDEASKIAE